MTTAVEPRASSRDLPLIAGSVAIVAWSFGPLIVRGISASAASIIVFRIAFAVPVMTAVAAAYALGGRITVLAAGTGSGAARSATCWRS